MNGPRRRGTFDAIGGGSPNESPKKGGVVDDGRGTSRNALAAPVTPRFALDSLVRSARPLARLAHELANPLAVVHGALELLELELSELPGELGEALRDAGTATAQLRGVLDALRHLSSNESVARLDDLEPLAHALLPAVGRRRAARAKLVVDAKPGLVVDARRGLFAHVLVSVLAWACERLTPTSGAAGRVTLRARPLGDRLVAVDVLATIETPGREDPPTSSSAPSGEGDPLELARVLLDEIGGSVHVESVEGPSHDAGRARLVLPRA